MLARHLVRLSLVVCVLSLASGTLGLASEGTKYGEGVTLTAATPIADIVAAPETYLGKTVRVDGTVTAVCEEMGCWMELSDPAISKGLRFKVEDGVIVFPLSAKGRRASAQGAVEKIGQGESATYRVKATGAVVY
jgi:hypothetical protein